MTYAELKKHLESLHMFSETEISSIIRTCGTATIGTAVIACQILDINLSGRDVDVMFNR